MLERAYQIGEPVPRAVHALKERCPLVREVRVKGAMIGVELAAEGAAVVAELPGTPVAGQLHPLDRDPAPAGGLTISDEQIDDGCDILDEVILGLK